MRWPPTRRLLTAPRGMVLDAGLAVCGTGLDVLVSAGGWSDRTPVWVGPGLALLAGPPMGLLRRWPGPVAVYLAVLLVVCDQAGVDTADTLQILLPISVGVLALSRGWDRTLPVAAAAFAATAVNIADPGVALTLHTWLSSGGLVVAPVLIGRYAGVRRAQTRHAAELAAERARAGRLAERERIAREVHDIVAHHVGAMVLRASAAQYAGASGPAAEALADIRETGHRVLEDLRGLLAVLRDPREALGPDLSLADMLAEPDDVLRDAVARMSAAGLRVDLRLPAEAERAPLVVRASAARIVQEGLTNVLKHAGPGTRAEVSVGMRPDALTVEVRNGPGPSRPPEPLPSHGQGIAGMRERAGALGGHVTAGPDGDGGWRLAATLPLRGHATPECGLRGRFT